MGFFLLGLTLGDVLSTTWSILLVVIGLGMLIFVHELGHFLVAKLCGVKVEKFYLGFDIAGMKLLKFVRGETEYGIGAIPLGGYVKMLGQVDNPAQLKEEFERAKAEHAATIQVGEGGEAIDVREAEQALYDPRSYLAQSVPERMAIISAGVVMNVIFAFITGILAYKLGVFQEACGVGEVAPGEAAWQENLRPGDRIVSIAGQPTRRFEDLRRSVSLGDIDQGVPMTIERPGAKEAIAVRIEPDRKGLAPTIGITNPRKTSLGEPVAAMPGSVAWKVEPKFQSGDRVVRVNDTAIGEDQYGEIHRQLALHADEELRFTVRRQVQKDGKAQPNEFEELTIAVPPQPVVSLGLVMEMGPIVAVQDDSPAAKAGVQADDVLVKIDGEPVGDPMTLADRLRKRAASGKTAVSLVVLRDGEPKTLQTELRLPDWYETPFRERSPVSVPALGIAFKVEPKVASVVAGSPAAEAGIAAGDVVEQMKIVPPDRKTLEAQGYGKSAKYYTDETYDLRQDKKGWSSWAALCYALQMMPEGTTVELTLAGDRTATLAPQPVADRFNPDRGLRFETLGNLVQAANWGEAVRLGGQETTDALTMVVQFLRKLFSSQVSPRAMGGPITIAQIAYHQASKGLADLLIFLTVIGANLAVLNFLPIPLLDGGHFVFLMYEGITGRAPNQHVQTVLTYVGLFFVLGLFLLVFGLDIGLISRQ